MQDAKLIRETGKPIKVFKPSFAPVVMLFSVLFLGACGESSTDRDNDVHGAWAYMQLFVENTLKNPKSAEFRYGGFRDVEALGEGRYRVDSYVDAENSFGGTIRTEFEGVIVRTEDGWRLESLDFK